MASAGAPESPYSHLKQIYHEYRHLKYIPAKGAFFSPKCMQVCRPIPDYAATKRETILLYLVQAAGFKDLADYELAQSSAGAAQPSATDKPAKEDAEESAEVQVEGLKHEVYSIRPLKPNEATEILTEDVVSPLGMTPLELEELKKRERWVGMRVELWDASEGEKPGRLIRVNYWWREEEVDGERRWLQCFHDIISIGDRDGTEGLEGDVLE
jgi:hypothetical protein